MGRCETVLLAAAMTLLPRVAAATVFNFYDTETSALSPTPQSFMFSLDTATAVGDASGTTFNNVSITDNGATISGNTIGASFTTYLSSPLFFLIDTGLQPFYSGVGTGITFNVGSFPVADGATDGEGTLTISAGTAPPVPEPATWTLLLTGCSTLAAAGRFSRRSHSSNRSAV